MGELRAFPVLCGSVGVPLGPSAAGRFAEWLGGYGSVVVVAGKGRAWVSGGLCDVGLFLGDEGVSYRVVRGVELNPGVSEAGRVVRGVWGFGAEVAVGSSVVDFVKFVAEEARAVGKFQGSCFLKYPCSGFSLLPLSRDAVVKAVLLAA